MWILLNYQSFLVRGLGLSSFSLITIICFTIDSSDWLGPKNALVFENLSFILISSRRIREWSNSLSGRAQLAAEKYADGIETIPLVLAENAGMDPLDTQVQLRAKATTPKPKYGVDVLNAKIADMSAKDVYEPLAVKV